MRSASDPVPEWLSIALWTVLPRATSLCFGGRPPLPRGDGVQDPEHPYASHSLIKTGWTLHRSDPSPLLLLDATAPVSLSPCGASGSCGGAVLSVLERGPQHTVHRWPTASAENRRMSPPTPASI